MADQPDTAAAVRRSGSVQAAQCRKDNEAEVNAFLHGIHCGLYASRRYGANPHGGWQGIYDRAGLVTQVWVGSWLVALPEMKSYINVPDHMFRDLYEVPDAT